MPLHDSTWDLPSEGQDVRDPHPKIRGRDTRGRYLGGDQWVPPANYRPFGSPGNRGGGFPRGSLKRNRLLRCRHCGAIYENWAQVRYCSKHCRLAAREKRRRDRGLTKRMRLGQMRRLTPFQRHWFYATERPDDPLKSRFEQTQIPVLGIPLSAQLEDALAHLIVYTRGDANRLLASIPDRPLSRDREAVATHSAYERSVHDLLLWALRVAIEPHFRGWLRRMMNQGRGLMRKRKRTRKPSARLGTEQGV